MSKGDRKGTLDLVNFSLWVDVRAHTTIVGARNTDARLVAPIVSKLLVEPSSSSSTTTPTLQTARAHRGSPAEHLDSSSPVENMRTRLPALRGPAWGTQTLEREVIEHRHLDEEALLDRRGRDLESAIDPNLPLAPWCETCVLGHGIEALHVRLTTPLEGDEKPIIAVDFAVRKARADDGEPMTTW